jgi:hypothetical protein
MSDLKEAMKNPTLEQMSSSTMSTCISMSSSLLCLVIILAFVAVMITSSTASDVNQALLQTPSY